MLDDEIIFSISFETVMAHSNRGEKSIVPLYYNDFVNMIVRDSRWPSTVSFVSAGAARGKLLSTNWAAVDFPNMIETIVVNG